jgi:hypothetical protein
MQKVGLGLEEDGVMKRKGIATHLKTTELTAIHQLFT